MSQSGSGNHLVTTKIGISNNNVYTIIDAKEYRDTNQIIKLLRLRNPWGHTEFSGDYSD